MAAELEWRGPGLEIEVRGVVCQAPRLVRLLGRHFLILAGCASLAACGAGGGGSEAQAAPDPAPGQGFQMKSGDLGDDDFDKIVDKYGALNGMYSKDGARKPASENTMVNDQFTGNYGTQQFQGKRDYDKRSFWGRKDYAKQVYEGETAGGDRFLTEAREGTRGAREGSMVSRENSRVFNTSEVAGSEARENRQANLSKPSDAETDVRRRVYPQPEIRNWRTQRGLTVDDTRGMLGR